MLRATLSTELPETLAVGRGTVLPLDGSCVAERETITDLAVVLNGHEYPVEAHGMPSSELGGGGGRWWAMVPLTPVPRSSEVWIRLRARLAGGRVELQPSDPS